MIKKLFRLLKHDTLIIKKNQDRLKNYCGRMVVEIEGETKIKKNTLLPRSAPILFEFELNVKNENKNSSNDNLRCMVVEFELMNDDVTLNKEVISDNSFSKNINGTEFESSVAYLSKTHKRVYLENETNLKIDELLNETKGDKLSKNSERRCKRKNIDIDSDCHDITGYKSFRKILKLEKWLFGNKVWQINQSQK